MFLVEITKKRIIIFVAARAAVARVAVDLVAEVARAAVARVAAGPVAAIARAAVARVAAAAELPRA